MECDRPAGTTNTPESKNDAIARAMAGTSSSSAGPSGASTASGPQTSSASTPGRTLKACDSDETHRLRRTIDCEFVQATNNTANDDVELSAVEPPTKHTRPPLAPEHAPAPLATAEDAYWQRLASMFASQSDCLRADIARVELSLDQRFTAGLQVIEARLLGKVVKVEALTKQNASLLV